MDAPQKPGLLARILLTVTTLALVVVGFFFLTVALVVGGLIALVIGVRFWWMLRKLKHADPGRAATGNGSSSGDALDGEYQVVERESTDERLPPSPPSQRPPDPNSTPPAP